MNKSSKVKLDGQRASPRRLPHILTWLAYVMKGRIVSDFVHNWSKGAACVLFLLSLWCIRFGLQKNTPTPCLIVLWRFITPLNKILAAQISFCPV
jgi:hypothetical protein